MFEAFPPQVLAVVRRYETEIASSVVHIRRRSLVSIVVRLEERGTEKDALRHRALLDAGFVASRTVAVWRAAGADLGSVRAPICSPIGTA